MMDTSLQVNTHFYDGKVKHIKDKISRFVVPEADREKDIKSFREEIKDEITGVALGYFDGIVKGRVYDNLNQLDPVELLFICFQIYKKLKDESKKDFVSILNIQLEDMATGFCPQGQTIRLLQLIYSFDTQVIV